LRARRQRDAVFCPLCKAEFRDGFTHCSDCYIPLVATKQEADRQAVTSAWRGGDKVAFELVLTALERAEIPLQFLEHLNFRAAARSSLRSIVLGRPNHGHETEFEVRVLGSDAERALIAIHQALDETEDD
jgi:phosphotransferase system HPr-like phosphotransfer protein